MTLATHGIVGAAAASLFPAVPVVGVLAGFASHFIIDAIPHWDYQPRSLQKDTVNPLNTDIRIGIQFIKDLTVMGLDTFLGLAVSIVLCFAGILHAPLYLVVLGTIAGVLPDALQFIYFKTRTKLLLHLQRFHIWIQSGAHLRGYHPVIGLFAQLVLIVAIVYFAHAF